MLKQKQWKVKERVLVKLKYVKPPCDYILARDVLVLKQSHHVGDGNDGCKTLELNLAVGTLQASVY